METKEKTTTKGFTLLGDPEQEEKTLIPSKAVCVNNGDDGIVLHYIGTNISEEIANAGSARLDELGLDNAPAGITVWEGKAHWTPGPWEHPQDGDVELRGTFRDPTDEEWLSIRNGDSPW